MKWNLLAVVFAVGILAGCGPSPQPKAELDFNASKDRIRNYVQEMAHAEEVPQAPDTMAADLDTLKQQDAALATEVESGIAEIKSNIGKPAAKTKAEALVQKLQ